MGASPSWASEAVAVEDARRELAREGERGREASRRPSEDTTLKGSPWPFCSRSSAPERDLGSFRGLSPWPSTLVSSISISGRSRGEAARGCPRAGGD